MCGPSVLVAYILIEDYFVSLVLFFKIIMVLKFVVNLLLKFAARIEAGIQSVKQPRSCFVLNEEEKRKIFFLIFFMKIFFDIFIFFILKN